MALLSAARRLHAVDRWLVSKSVLQVDHCGGAIGPFCLAQGGPAKNIEWEIGIARLAALPNVYMKVGGLQMSVNGFHVGREARPAPFAGGDAVQYGALDTLTHTAPPPPP